LVPQVPTGGAHKLRGPGDFLMSPRKAARWTAS